MEYNGFTIPTWLMDIFLFIGVIVIIELLTIGCLYYIAWKFNASGDLKQYNFLIRIFLYLLAVPVIIFGLLPMLGIYNSLFDESDILGYYGALIGGGVTVLGVYWTLKHESENSKEETRKNSLPVLSFNFSPEHISYDKGTLTECKTDKDGNSFSDYDIAIDTTVEGFKEYSNQSFIEYGKLNIENIGLGVAVFSEIYLFRENKFTVCYNLNRRRLGRFLVVPGKEISLNMFIRSDDFDEGDQLSFYFTDLYSNEYNYNISFENMGEKSSYYKTTIESNTVEPIPTLSQRARRRRRNK